MRRPVAGGGGEVVALVGGGASQRQRLGMLRFRLERTQHQRLGIAPDLAGVCAATTSAQSESTSGSWAPATRRSWRRQPWEVLPAPGGSAPASPSPRRCRVGGEVLSRLPTISVTCSREAPAGPRRSGRARRACRSSGRCRRQARDGEAGGERPRLARPAVGAVGRLGGHLGPRGHGARAPAALRMGRGVDAASASSASRSASVSRSTVSTIALWRICAWLVRPEQQRRQDQ